VRLFSPTVRDPACHVVLLAPLQTAWGPGVGMPPLRRPRGQASEGAGSSHRRRSRRSGSRGVERQEELGLGEEVGGGSEEEDERGRL
jgi:hypothetical protein